MKRTEAERQAIALADIKHFAALLGRRGGLAKSRAKARAARENGKKGGRPASAKSGARTRRRA